MRRYLFLISIFLISFISSAQFIDDEEPEYAEEQQVPKFTDRLFFGGNIGLVFGQYTYVNLSPIIGYRINSQLSAGTGFIYEYVSDKRYKPYYETTIFGGKFFAQYVLFDFLILYAEDNILSLEKKYYDVIHNFPTEGRFMLNVPWIGGGFYQQAGKGGMYFMILFNLNNGPNSPYSSYEYRIGFNF